MSPWTFTGDGVATEFPIRGRKSTDPADYRVEVGGVTQTPGRAYTLPAKRQTIQFGEAPARDLTIIVIASEG